MAAAQHTNALAAAFQWFDAKAKAGTGHAPLLIKSNRLSAVHRRVRLDLVIVPEMKGKTVETQSIHAGLWTSAALATEEVRRVFDRMFGGPWAATVGGRCGAP